MTRRGATRPNPAPAAAPNPKWNRVASASCWPALRRTPARLRNLAVIFSGGMPPIRPSCLAPNMITLMKAVASDPALAPRSSRFIRAPRVGSSARPPEVAAPSEQEHHENDYQDQCQHSYDLRTPEYNYRIV